MDLDNLLTVSEIVTRAALERKESRGAQFRDDYPEKSEEWGKYNLRVTEGRRRQPQRRADVPWSLSRRSSSRSLRSSK